MHRSVAQYILAYLVWSLLCATALGQDLNISGDFRFRSEHVDTEDLPYRGRDRIRAQLQITKRLSYNTEFGLGLVTGGGDPVSHQVTLGNFSNSKAVTLNLAYVVSSPLTGLYLGLGKIHNPFFRVGDNQLLFDRDFKPEGYYGSYVMSMSGLTIQPTVGQFWLQENPAGSDQKLLALQILLAMKVSNVSLKLTAGQYDFKNTEGQETLRGANGNDVVGASDTYLYGFTITQLGFSAGMNFNTIPSALYIETVKNGEADEGDQGKEFGISIGELTRGNSFQGVIAKRDLEANATIGSYTDSEFGGGTDKSGLKLSLAYAFLTDPVGKLTHYKYDSSLDNGLSIEKTQIDIALKF